MRPWTPEEQEQYTRQDRVEAEQRVLQAQMTGAGSDKVIYSFKTKYKSYEVTKANIKQIYDELSAEKQRYEILAGFPESKSRTEYSDSLRGIRAQLEKLYFLMKEAK